MRILIFVPVGPAATRVREMLRREVGTEGHDFAGYVESAEAAQAAISTGAADEVWTPERHVSAVVPWLRVRHGHRSRKGLVLIPALGALWWLLRRRPLGSTATAAVMTGLVAAILAPGPAMYDAAPRPSVTRTAPMAEPTVEPTEPATEQPIVPVADIELAQEPDPTAEATPTVEPAVQPSPTPTCLIDVELDLLGLPVEVCAGL